MKPKKKAAAPVRDRTRVRERERVPAKKETKPEESPSLTKKRWIALSYQIIEHKIMYYYPELIKEGYRPGLEITDQEYDLLEREYLNLCIKLDMKNTVVHQIPVHLEGKLKGDGMMQVDFTRPVVHLIMRKYGVPNWQDKVSFNTQKED